MRQGLPLAALAALLLSATPAARAQSPDAALAARWDTICLGATADLALRCADILAGGPGSREIAAGGNALDEIPGQGRAATRDGAPDAAAGVELAAGWSLFFSADRGRLKRRDGINEAPFDGDTGSLTAGIDWRPAENWQLALLLNHARDDIDYLGSAGRMRTASPVRCSPPAGPRIRPGRSTSMPAGCPATTTCAARSATPCPRRSASMPSPPRRWTPSANWPAAASAGACRPVAGNGSSVPASTGSARASIPIARAAAPVSRSPFRDAR